MMGGMMNGGMMSGGMGLGMVFGGIFWRLILALLVYGIFWLVRQAGSQSQSPAGETPLVSSNGAMPPVRLTSHSMRR